MPATKHRGHHHSRPGFDRFAEFNAGRLSGQLLPGSSPFTGVVVLDPDWTPAHRGVSEISDISSAPKHDRPRPPHVAAEVAALREDGWVEVAEAETITGRPLMELCILDESGEAPIRQVGSWWDGPVVATVHMVHLPTLECAPRRQPLRLVHGGEH